MSPWCPCPIPQHIAHLLPAPNWDWNYAWLAHVINRGGWWLRSVVGAVAETAISLRQLTWPKRRTRSHNLFFLFLLLFFYARHICLCLVVSCCAIEIPQPSTTGAAIMSAGRADITCDVNKCNGPCAEALLAHVAFFLYICMLIPHRRANAEPWLMAEPPS